MKIRALLMITILTPLFVFAQSRENRAKLSFVAQSGVLNKATGWAYNSKLGEWIDYENCINPNKDFKEKYKALLNGYMQSQQNQNFLTIQTKAVEFSGAKYYVLIIEKWRGRYKYESIQEDWYEWKETFGYLFAESDYAKLQSMEGKTELKTQMFVSIGSIYEKYDETKFLDLIQTELSQVKSKYATELTFPVISTESDGKKVIRFFIPERFSASSQYDFEKKYFEVLPVDFEKILIQE